MNPEPPNGPRARELVILHFNDVYEIDAREREPVGGVARFISMLDTFASENPLVLFSGDFLAPSLLSIATRGMHMVPFFNRMKIGAAVIGNHDLDFGLEVRRRAVPRRGAAVPSSAEARAARAATGRPTPLAAARPSIRPRARARPFSPRAARGARPSRPRACPTNLDARSRARRRRRPRWLPPTSPSCSPT
jgi:hypothetical protein